ncbi:hypothetical protein FG386_002562 [Cryptosporidium ryanae]|uniref:uncharacterized protein n=1 Tax=Cryptosporidium ryanae TaxID=515981 RepID=UPI00351AAA21|nr:hypothetical protein FG386_002562 [Cryptosporidium ryanae]
MEMLINGTSIPPISAKLLFGFKNKINSFSECELKWGELNSSEKLRYESDSILIKKKLKNTKPLQSWKKSILDVSAQQMFYFFNYHAQISLHPYLSEEEIIKKCNSKLNHIKSNKKILSLIKDNTDKLVAHTKKI